MRQNTAIKPKFQPGLLARTQEIRQGMRDKSVEEQLDNSILEGTSVIMQLEKTKKVKPHPWIAGGKQNYLYKRNKYNRA